MKRWTVLWYRLRGGPSRHYDEDLFDWWTWVRFYVSEYCYLGMDYWGDLDLLLLANAQWGDIGMLFKFSMYVKFLYFYIWFSLVTSQLIRFLFEPNMGLVRPEGHSRHMWRAGAPDATEIDWVFWQVERHLDRLIVAVSMTEIEDLPIAYWR